ncbi:hypothetical protein F5Y11DRAFT_365714 [Daldinia sp. FL1419]|nr:hypothetical protein F5Y11DRAFT_365714 [Daldinia sp. FL1419]
MSIPVTNRPFSGKEQRIRAQIENFNSIESAQVDATAYLDQTPDHEYSQHDNWIKAKTPFTDHGKLTDLTEGQGENVVLIGNRNSFATIQYGDNPKAAGMSMIHLLAIPKAGLFNGVSLTRDNVSIIDESIALFKKSWESERFRHRVLIHQLIAIKGAPEEVEAAQDLWKGLEQRANELTFDDFTFGLHLWPDNSIGHLHIHIIATPEWCRAPSTRAHDEKTKDALEVRDCVLGNAAA